MRVSIIICCHSLDRVQDVLEAVQSAMNQTYPLYEVIVAVDHNQDLLKRLEADLHGHARVVLNTGVSGLSDTRNAGIQSASGDIIAFIDDDATASEDWIEKLTRHYREPSVVAVGGRSVPVWLTGRPSWFPEELDWVVGSTYKGAPNATRPVGRIIGCNMSFRREVFQTAGLFRTDLGRIGSSGEGEDSEICIRVRHAIPGGLIIYDPEAIVYHKVPKERATFRYLISRSSSGGAAIARIRKLYAGTTGAPHPASTEGAYLLYLLTSALPRRIRHLYKLRVVAQYAAISTSIASTGTGYLAGTLRRRRVAERGVVGHRGSIAIIGSRGIPAAYGGFETVVEEIAPRLVEAGFKVFVSCEGGDRPDRPAIYKGVNLFYFPVHPFYRIVYESLYDIYSLVRTSRQCDGIYMLGYGVGLFFFIPRLLRTRLAVNVDGLEWKRSKFNRLERFLLLLNERAAVALADQIVVDSLEVGAYIESKYKKKTTYVPYGVEDPPREDWDETRLAHLGRNEHRPEIESGRYWLVVARLEPENNIHMIIQAFLASRSANRLVIVGDFSGKKYAKHVLDLVRRDDGEDRVLMPGSIYDQGLLNMLRQNCYAYIHGHSVGGTNPSLLEAMSMDNMIVAYDNGFNREVGGDTMLYFRDIRDLAEKIREVERGAHEHARFKEAAHSRVATKYTWDNVMKEYDRVFQGLCAKGAGR